ncbi:MAG: ABC transporter permease [Treponemataceae bacterium]|nr:ABC transporter permease [Treponemataceae bacterium]
MITVISEIIASSLPLLLASTGALVSELAGVMAVFMDGVINAASFITLASGTATGSVTAGILCSLVLCSAFTLLIAWFTEKTRANPFVTGIAMNLFLSGLISLCSQIMYGTKGVIYTEDVIAVFTQDIASWGRIGAILPVAAISALVLWAQNHTVWGLRTRCTGKAPAVLTEHGANPAVYRILAWGTAAALASLAGSLFTLRLSSFVPNISSGKGWLALAAVFLGRGSVWGTIGAVLLFSVTEYLANNWGLIPFLPQVSQTLLLGLPYLVCILLFVIVPARKK